MIHTRQSLTSNKRSVSTSAFDGCYCLIIVCNNYSIIIERQKIIATNEGVKDQRGPVIHLEKAEPGRVHELHGPRLGPYPCNTCESIVPQSL